MDNTPVASNLILRVSDLERSIAFYEGKLGLRLLGRGQGWAFLNAGGITLALREESASTPDTPPTELVFEVTEIGGSYDTLSADGVDFRVEPRMVTGDEHRQLHAADFTDPDGHVLSITGWVDVD